MFHKLFAFCLIIFFSLNVLGQNEPIKILEEQVANRMLLHALNESETDYDILISVEGTGFRQSKSKPRLIRVPAASKVRNIARLMLSKNEDLNYTYKLTLNDSLSRRALRKEFENIKIKPKKPITVYITENCMDCDSIMKPLEDSKWIFTKFNLAEKIEIKEQIKMAIPEVDTLTTPIFGLGGLLFPKILSYDQLMDEMMKEE